MRHSESFAKQLAYYPGCSLKTSGKVLDEQARKIAGIFGFELVEIPEWTCCGTVFPNSLADVMKFAGTYRMLAKAEQLADKLITLCSACFNVLKRSNKVIRENPEIAEKLCLFTEVEYKGGLEVTHYLEFLRDQVTYQALAKKSVKTAPDKIVPYYGCLLLRPADELRLDDQENPTLLAEIIATVGDIAIKIPAQNECCGAFLTAKPGVEINAVAEKITSQASAFGAAKIITSCPLCYYNLEKNSSLPVEYFTEYLARALGVN